MMRVSIRAKKFKAWDRKLESFVNLDDYMSEYVGSINDFFYNADKVDRLSIIQYTGIDDKNGVKIYEWYKVKAIQKATNEEFIGYVTFYNGGYIVRLLEDEGYYRLDAQQFKYEIVGNIFEDKV